MSSLYNYIDAQTFVEGTIKFANIGTAAASNNRNKKVIFKKYASFTDCINEINNVPRDDNQDIDVVLH